MRREMVVISGLALGLLCGCSAAGTPSDSVLGYQPWSSATVSTPTSRVLTVQADVESISEQLSCTPTAKAIVTETATTIWIHTEVINHALPPNVACAGVGRSSIRATVELARPIGGRTLIDEATGRTHSPLILSRSPVPHPVPPGFGPRHTSWIESGDEIFSWWRRSRHTAQINLDIRTSAEGFERAPRDAASVLISGAKGAMWATRDAPDTVEHHVIWTTPAGRAFDLDVIDQSSRPFTAQQVLAIARSIR